MCASVEKMTKSNKIETKMVLNGEPTNVKIEVVEEKGKLYVQCLVDSNSFDGVEVLDQIRSWASLFGVELPLKNIGICYPDPTLTRDIEDDESDIIGDLIDELCTD